MHIVHISPLPPTACGVAEYTSALASELRDQAKWATPFFVRLDYNNQRMERTDCRITINPSDERMVAEAAHLVNALGPSVVLLQHEFKLFGNENGLNVMPLLDVLTFPVVTTLHAVSRHFPRPRECVFTKILQRSSKLIVFSSAAANILRDHYRVPESKVKVIAHGVPDVPFRRPNEVHWPGLEHRSVKFVTLGLLRPTKGIEHVLGALARLRLVFDDFAYLIVGADHPRNSAAPEYRQQLLNLVVEYGLDDHVVFVNRFLEQGKLIKAVQACDVGLLPYTSIAQSSSGVLALFLSCGRPVIATDFQHATDLLNGENGIVVPSGDEKALASALKSIVVDGNVRRQMMKASYDSSRQWVWQEVARKHLEIIEEVAEDVTQVAISETVSGSAGK